ncbi:sugar ABC transporter permease [Oceanispirochaeta crateris]|jgi:alpha-glucoside transport system permease protein|uniref:Sugar ABC transporter permease n=1 Tax=Oceanispirochaeta crateris TaxID=2518645 RepID=A0A5C1QF12_9SPIO|nr:sugar ABC transporter permease [Oceanispirochaeta crateris]QEN06645.1 sugar ABC transporter permease [Oceanispirochaeta crateris]
MSQRIDSKWNRSVLVALVLLTFGVLVGGFAILQNMQSYKVFMTIFAVIWGLGSVALLYFVLNAVAESMPHKIRSTAVAVVFAGPAVVMLFWALVIPTLRSLRLSFADANGNGFVSFDNYKFAFTDPIMIESFRNNLLWMVFGTSFCIITGLLIAVLADKSKAEKIFKSLIFMPMAISFVGAGVIWKFMYAYKGEGINITEIGLLNAIVTAFGGEAQAWLLLPVWNNFLLIIIMVWLQTGYAMVILSSAIKGIPDEINEAARVDGANGLTIFFRITIPYIMPTIVTVTTTILIFSLKLFDIVRVMTGGNYGTNVMANEFYLRQFTYGNSGEASAIAIVLLVVIIPVLAYNLKQFRDRKVLK